MFYMHHERSLDEGSPLPAPVYCASYLNHKRGAAIPGCSRLSRRLVLVSQPMVAQALPPAEGEQALAHLSFKQPPNRRKLISCSEQ